MKEHDHAPLREAIIRITRETSMKVLVCPEDQTQMAVGKELLIDTLPDNKATLDDKGLDANHSTERIVEIRKTVSGQ